MMKTLKIQIKILLRFLRDLQKGYYFKFAKKDKLKENFKYSISLKQEIKKIEKVEDKIFNLVKSSKKINEYILLPNQIFSFWNIVNNPNKGFKNGRTLINGKIIDEVGGGLCQVSGIVYYVSLLAGLEVLERYNHSMDIYTEETRFTPLGTDATVVYGYKDLRIRNIFSFPIKFQLEVTDNSIVVNLRSTEKIEEHKVFFQTKIENEIIFVTVLDENNQLLNTSKYKKI